MSTFTSKKSGKTGKLAKSNSKAKSKPNIELKCKYRGKYDLNKKNNNKEINLDNAINLFEVIYKKNENLFKDTLIKMYKEKKMFSFGDKRGFPKIQHHVPYFQVSKFFVLHRDPTMIIMGVHHKTHKWFLVFQFNNVDDLSTFCDEIEGEKKYDESTIPSINAPEMRISVPHIEIDNVDNPYANSNEFERISIHSEMLNTQEMSVVNFDESFYDPDLISHTVNESTRSSSSSSRSSNYAELDNRVHCDNQHQTKLKDLFIKRGSQMYLDSFDWDEDVTFLNCTKNNDIEKSTKSGSIYMYCAQFRNKDVLDARSIKSEGDDEFYNHKPKLIKSTENSDKFKHMEPKLIKSIEDSDKFKHMEPKFIKSSQNSDKFKHMEPKFITEDPHGFNHFEPKLLSNESQDFDSKIYRTDSDSYNHFEPKYFNDDSGSLNRKFH